MAIFDARNSELFYERLCVLHFVLYGELVADDAGKAVVQKSSTIQEIYPSVERNPCTSREARE